MINCNKKLEVVRFLREDSRFQFDRFFFIKNNTSCNIYRNNKNFSIDDSFHETSGNIGRIGLGQKRQHSE